LTQPVGGASLPVALLAASVTGEIGLPSAREIRSQGNYSYCSLHSVVSFLELWGNSLRDPIKSLPSSDPALIGVAYNLEVGNGVGGHAVGHCDKLTTREPLCELFVEEMKTKKVSECLVIQNSWGVGVHAKGYSCLSREALQRMLTTAQILKSIP
jgi:hypothetical protein